MLDEVISSQRGIPAPLPRLQYSREEVAEIIGISLRTLDRVIAAKQLPVRRIGRRVLITSETLARFIAHDHPTVEHDNSTVKDDDEKVKHNNPAGTTQ